MTAIKPVMREVREAVLGGFAHARDKLHHLADNLSDHIDDMIRRIKDKDRFDDKPDTPNKPDSHRPGDGGGDPPVVITLKFKRGWNDAQKAEARTKVDDINARGPVVTDVVPAMRKVNVRRIFEALHGKGSAKGYDVDHILDLQLGGGNIVENLQLLTRSVNRSLGAQIAHRIKDLPSGTSVQVVIE